jgi:hypothetical protein
LRIQLSVAIPKPADLLVLARLGLSEAGHFLLELAKPARKVLVVPALQDDVVVLFGFQAEEPGSVKSDRHEHMEDAYPVKYPSVQQTSYSVSTTDDEATRLSDTNLISDNQRRATKLNSYLPRLSIR